MLLPLFYIRKKRKKKKKRKRRRREFLLCCRPACSSCTPYGKRCQSTNMRTPSGASHYCRVTCGGAWLCDVAFTAVTIIIIILILILIIIAEHPLQRRMRLTTGP